MDAPRPTLLVFTLGPEGECARRRLLPRRMRRAELDLHRACLEAVLEAGREAGCRLEVSSPARLRLDGDVRPARQRGPGFGARLAAAADAAFERAPGPLVVVGTDVPELGAGAVRRALERLDGDPRRVVLGPSPDGGIYLLAAARPLGELLAGVPWCRRDTARRLSELLTAHGFQVEVLEPLADLDRSADLHRWLADRRRRRSGAPIPLRRLADSLARLLAALRRPPVPRRAAAPRLAPVPVRTGRSPPPNPFA